VIWGLIWAFFNDSRIFNILRGGLFGGVISSAITHTLIIGFFENMTWEKAIGCLFLGGVQGGVFGLAIGCLAGIVIVVVGKLLHHHCFPD
jgi:hypothetical protein